MRRSRRPPARRFYYLCGCDGTGKTTHSELLAAHLAGRGKRVRRVWLRFPFLTSLPLLAYARRRGLSGFYEVGGVRHGTWDFGRSRLLRTLLPWSLLLDAVVMAIPRIYLPWLLGATVVCERFAFDIVADLVVAYGDPGFAGRLPGRFYRRLVPPRAIVIMLDLDAETIYRRRPGLRSDARLPARLAAFRGLAESYGLRVVSNDQPFEFVQCQILAAGGAHG